MLVRHSLLLLLACFLLWATESSGAEQPKPLVRTLVVQAKDIVPVEDFVGKTTGSLSVQIRAQVGGILRKRNFQEGDHVKKGDVLFEIAPEVYQTNYDRAKAKTNQALAVYENAQREWTRAQTLYSKNAVSQKTRDQAYSALNSARADYEAAQASQRDAKIQLSYAYVTAPVSGYTSKEYQTEGNLITTTGDSSLLTELVQMDPIYVEFSLPNTDLLELRQLVTRGFATWGDKPKAMIRFADGSEYEHPGEINFFDHKVDPVTSVVRARASFPNPEGLILPGQFVRIAISGPVLTKAIAIPRSSILETQQGPMVIVVDAQNKASSRKITLLLNMDENAIVEKGLTPGEKIVTEGINKIRDGQTVQEIQTERNL
ncbi:MAG: efflux RND transporter periplasmic adaptor subunit [Desulfovibrio sp.]|nr:efflux RND transporter periplasmic adaptor subunit [Desulfovibrio sp.]